MAILKWIQLFYLFLLLNKYSAAARIFLEVEKVPGSVSFEIKAPKCQLTSTKQGFMLLQSH